VERLGSGRIPLGLFGLLLGLIWVCLLFGGTLSQASDACPSCSVGDFRQEREHMVATQIRARGVTDPAVLEAMSRIPRHCFVPPGVRGEAYEDHPLPIGQGQTISQPYIVALMTESLNVGPKDRVLEVGTGSGYQAAVLSVLVSEVFTVEIEPDLARQAAMRLACLGYRNVRVRLGDGRLGWEERAPFDAIIVTAAAPTIPPALGRQLKAGGRMCIPLGGADEIQNLTVLEKDAAGRLVAKKRVPVRFVPLRGGP
jgi:protein-L-isoaspartate(D-aspartate) O-methyltransferase